MDGSLLNHLSQFFAWPGPLFMIAGVITGLIFGVLPGLGGTQAMALLIPLTYGMNSDHAMILLVGIMSATPAGGSVTAVLINTPGTPQSAATCFDGFPLAQQGKAKLAIGASAMASMLGAFVGIFVLLMILPVGKYVVLAISYPEYFMLSLLGLTAIIAVSRGALWKGIISGALGLTFAFFGYDPITGVSRFTFGTDYLWDGIKLIPALIGIFAIATAIQLTVEGRSTPSTQISASESSVFQGARSVFTHFWLFLRSALLGTVIGIIPGVGGATANFLAYLQAVQTSKDKTKFGKGDIRGVIASESSNNAKDGGSLVPTLLFGIPGSAEMAVFLAALILHGLDPGPTLITENPGLVDSIVFALVAGNILASLLVLLGAGPLSRVSFLPGSVIASSVIVLSMIGAYATQGAFGDVAVALFFGALGYMMQSFGFSRVALLIGLVLARLFQKSFFQTLEAFGWTGFFTRPISLILFMMVLWMLFYPFLKRKRR